ncbi:MAG: hypothetical protein RSE60_07170 [Erysipelotrichaceae bacterium]|uniref:hypothetical protein n=1 Tax=Anaerorhabdus sp. TaxID=1872524 RepID=UPI002FC7A32A
MDIAKILIDICLQNPNVDMSQIQGNSKSNPLIDLPKMDKLIEYGMVSTGDEIYVNTDRDNSKAILIHENMLILKGEN